MIFLPRNICWKHKWGMSSNCSHSLFSDWNGTHRLRKFGCRLALSTTRLTAFTESKIKGLEVNPKNKSVKKGSRKKIVGNSRWKGYKVMKGQWLQLLVWWTDAIKPLADPDKRFIWKAGPYAGWIPIPECHKYKSSDFRQHHPMHTRPDKPLLFLLRFSWAPCFAHKYADSLGKLPRWAAASLHTPPTTSYVQSQWFVPSNFATQKSCVVLTRPILE